MQPISIQNKGKYIQRICKNTDIDKMKSHVGLD